MIYDKIGNKTEVIFTKEGVVQGESKNYLGKIEKVFKIIQENGFDLESKV